MDESTEGSGLGRGLAGVDVGDDLTSNIDIDIFDPEKMGEAVFTLVASYLYHNAEDPERLATNLVLEYEMQSEYLEEELYKPTIIRQAALIEHFLSALLTQHFLEEKGEELSNSEEQFIQRHLGYSGRHHLVSMLGILSESEEQAISELIGARNDLAHNPWLAFSLDADERFERIAVRVHDMLGELIEDDELMEDVSQELLEEFE